MISLILPIRFISSVHLAECTIIPRTDNKERSGFTVLIFAAIRAANAVAALVA